MLVRFGGISSSFTLGSADDIVHDLLIKVTNQLVENNRKMAEGTCAQYGPKSGGHAVCMWHSRRYHPKCAGCTLGKSLLFYKLVYCTRSEGTRNVPVA